jgi:hypothetical protein
VAHEAFSQPGPWRLTVIARLTRTLGITRITVQPAEISTLLARLDGSGSDSEWGAIAQLRKIPSLPARLAEQYDRAKLFGARAACVYHCTAYASSSESAYLLGLRATEDKSAVVRYRAALLLAVAQRDQSIPALQAMQDRYWGKNLQKMRRQPCKRSP